MSLIQFRAMNTDIEFMLAESSPEKLEECEQAIRDWFEVCEQRFSRFRSDSELSKINQKHGIPILVSEAMFEVLTLAELYREKTHGIFSCLLLDALENSGYRTSFDWLKDQQILYYPTPLVGHHSMRLNRFMKSVQLSQPARLDLGGIAKSWTVHRLAGWLKSKWQIERGFLNAGGDLTAWGGADATNPWLIGVADPWNTDADLATIRMHDGSAATSSTLGRRWQTDRGPMHHLINPHTLQPSTSDVIQCTVVGTDVTECEVWAKTVCILGSRHSLSILKHKIPHSDAVFVTKQGHIHFFGKQQSFQQRWDDLQVDFYHFTD